MVKIWPRGVCLNVSVACPGGPQGMFGKALSFNLMINSFFGKPSSGHMETKIGHLETQTHHFEARSGPKQQKAGFGPQIFQNASPKFFLANSFCGAKPAYQRNLPKQGGPHKTRQEATMCGGSTLLKLQTAVWKLKLAIWNPKIGYLETKMGSLEFKTGRSAAKMGPFEAKTGHFEVENCHLEI